MKGVCFGAVLVLLVLICTVPVSAADYNNSTQNLTAINDVVDSLDFDDIINLFIKGIAVVLFVVFLAVCFLTFAAIVDKFV